MDTNYFEKIARKSIKEDGKSFLFARKMLVEKGLDTKHADYIVKNIEKEIQFRNRLIGYVYIVSGILLGIFVVYEMKRFRSMSFLFLFLSIFFFFKGFFKFKE